MLKALLPTVGVLALLGVGVVGVGSLLVVKDRIRIEVQLDAPATDNLALVRDDIRTLQADLSALTGALEQHLSQRAEQDAAASAAELAHDTRVETILSAIERNLQAAATRTEQLAAQMSVMERGGAAGRAQPTDTVAVPTPAPAAPVTPVEPATQPAPQQPAAAPAPAPAAKGFLGFLLPNRSFGFDRVQSYEVLGELSRVGFDAKSTLHDFSGVTSKVRGAFTANLADPAASFSGSVACEAATLVSGVEGRDEAMDEHLDTEHHADIAFTVQSFTPDENGIDRQKMTVRGSVSGTMRIRGVEKPLTMPVTISVDASRRLLIEGQSKVHLPDFAVPVPDKVVISMQPDVVIWIALRARMAAGGEHAK